MGFFVEPLKVQVQDQSFAAIFISWDGIDPSKLTLKDLAKELCVEPRYLLGEILLHDANEEALDQLVEQTRAFTAKHKKEVLERGGVLDFFSDPDDDPGDDSGAKFYHMRLMVELGFPFPSLELEFKSISGIVARLAMDKASWAQCRVSQSKLSMRNRAEVDRYKDALKALLPKVKTLEAQIAAADAAGKSFRENAGKAGLNALGLLSVTHEMTAVYAQQDAAVGRLVAKTQELVELVGAEVAKDAKKAIEPSLGPLRESYEDRDFNAALLDYFQAWDPTLVYYFEAVALRAASGDSKDFKDFDKRLFKAISRASELLGELDSHAVKVADELDAAAQATWQKAVVEKLAFKSRAERDTKVRELVDKLMESTDAGWVSTAIAWSGVGTNAVGNMEGPPSVLSLILKFLTRNEKFAERLGGRDGMLRAFVLIGVDPVEREVILALLKKNTEESLKTARTVYLNGSWRSPTVFVTYTCVVAAVLIFHVHNLATKLDENADFSELVKAALPIVQDATNVLLIGLTRYYSKEMGAYLRSKGASNLRALNAEIDRLEKLTPAARAARVAHVGLTGVTLILAVWTLVDDSITANKFEDRLLKLSVTGAAMTFIGAFTVSSWIGPVGVVIGVVVAAVLLSYQAWFKPKFANAMQAVSKTLLADSYLKSKGAVVVGQKTVFILFQQNVSLKELLEETVEELNDFPWASKLDEDHVVDYARAGLPLERVAELYGMPLTQVRKRVQEARFSERERLAAAVKSEIFLVRPASTSVVLAVGAVNEIRIEVTTPDPSRLPRNMWLEVEFDDPDALLADNGQTPATTYNKNKQVVMLFARSRTRFARMYEGSFRLNLRPPDGLARLMAFVADDPNAVEPETSLFGTFLVKNLVFTVGP